MQTKDLSCAFFYRVSSFGKHYRKQAICREFFIGHPAKDFFAEG
jgi:hypothetical protein